MSGAPDSAPVVALGIDGGLAHLGWAVAHVYGNRLTIVASGCIETVRDGLKTRAADNMDRAMRVHDALAAVVEQHKPTVAAAEAMSFPRNTAAAAMLSQSLGVVAAILARHKIPLSSRGPMELKQAISGSRTANKGAVISAVRAKYPEVRWPARRDLWEHIGDAVSALHAQYPGRA